jgi:hypothetical protein
MTKASAATGWGDHVKDLASRTLATHKEELIRGRNGVIVEVLGNMGNDVDQIRKGLEDCLNLRLNQVDIDRVKNAAAAMQAEKEAKAKAAAAEALAESIGWVWSEGDSTWAMEEKRPFRLPGIMETWDEASGGD